MINWFLVQAHCLWSILKFNFKEDHRPCFWRDWDGYTYHHYCECGYDPEKGDKP